MRLLGYFGCVSPMAFECSRKSKFTQFVSYHIFCYENRFESAAIVNIDGVPHEFGCDSGTPGPSLDRLLFATFIHLIDLLLKALIDVKTFFN